MITFEIVFFFVFFVFFFKKSKENVCTVTANMDSNEQIDLKFFCCIRWELCHLQGHVYLKKFYLHNLMARKSRQQLN